MTKRGRTSVAEMSTAAILSPIMASDRLVAPAHLSDAELSVWAEVVNDQPADAFSATHIPLLEMYCRHVVQSRVIADELLNFDRSWMADDEGLKRYDRLLAMQEREGRAASSLATRLRLTRQAVEHPRTTMRALANKPKSRKPWELPDSDD
jgi:hypothetical protein